MAGGAPGPGDGGEQGRARELGLDALRFLDEPLHVELVERPHAAAQRLLAFLGVTWKVVSVRPTPIKAKLDAEAAAARAAAKPAVVEKTPEPGAPRRGWHARGREEIEWADKFQMVARCGIEGCGWSVETTAGEGRELARVHRLESHPELAGKVGGKKSGRTKGEKEGAARRDMHDRADQRSGLDALQRMDAGEPQQPAQQIGVAEEAQGTKSADQAPPQRAVTAEVDEASASGDSTGTAGAPEARSHVGDSDQIGEGGPDATEPTSPAAEPPTRVDAPSASSPSPVRKKHTRESIIAAVKEYAAEHDGYGPPSNIPPWQSMRIAARRLGLTWSQVIAQAEVAPALSGRVAWKHKRENGAPLDAEAALRPASASSGPGVGEKAITSSGEGPAILSSGAPADTDECQLGVSVQAPELGREPDGSGDSRAPELLDLVEPSRAEPSRAEPSRAEPSRAEPSRAEPEPPHLPAVREPIRTAEIPYDIHLLQDEAAYLRERANALEQIAAGLHRLQQLTTTVKETP